MNAQMWRQGGGEGGLPTFSGAKVTRVFRKEIGSPEKTRSGCSENTEWGQCGEGAEDIGDE